MSGVAESVRSVVEEHIDEGTRARLVGSFSHQNDDGDLVIATDLGTILKIVGGITAALLAFRAIRWTVPKLWKIKWPLLASGVAVAVYVAFYKDRQ